MERFDRLAGANGVTRFIEVGAGGVLTGLLRNIDPALERREVRRGGGLGEGRRVRITLI